MGIGKKLSRAFGGGGVITREECFTDKETGQFKCHAKDINKDGTEVDQRGFTVDVDASCKAVVTEEYENQDPAKLEEFEHRKLPKVLAKCKNKPADY